MNHKYNESDYIGKKFGRLRIMELSHIDDSRIRQMKCLCDCGNIKIICLYDVLHGKTKSCGCLSVETCGYKHRIHGMTGSREYKSWVNMRTRCFNKKSRAYKWYGARGITVCDRWANSFENFYADMGEMPKGYTLERNNNDENYSPENCTWETRLKQLRNVRSNHNLTFNGETYCVSEWAEKIGISGGCLRQRIDKLNWSVEKALTTPIMS